MPWTKLDCSSSDRRANRAHRTRHIIPKPSGAALEPIPVERMGDSRCRRIWRGARNLSARQRGIRIDLECDGDQRQNKNDGQGPHRQIVSRDCGQIGETFRQKAEAHEGQ
jgi:hypothetical protein